MNLTEKKLISVFTLVGTLSFYYYGKRHHKDTVPFTVVGAFAGAWIGEIIANQLIRQSTNNDQNGNNE